MSEKYIDKIRLIHAVVVIIKRFNREIKGLIPPFGNENIIQSLLNYRVSEPTHLILAYLSSCKLCGCCVQITDIKS